MKRFVSLFCLALSAWIIGFWHFTQLIPHNIGPIHTEYTEGTVVLTGGTGRVREGIHILEQGKTSGLLISGVAKDARLQDVQSLNTLLLDEQFKALKPFITLGKEATNTIGNAFEAASWIQENQFKNVRLITSNYHMPRSLLLFHYALPNREIIPHPVQSAHFKLSQWWKFPGTARLMFLEYHKYWAAKIWITYQHIKNQIRF
jgi:uncharacterized SAM-binding protein YcdF (DUF218 family)